MKNFLEAKCTCKENAYYSYSSALYRTEVWPVELYPNESIQYLLDGLENFHYTKAEEACATCSADEDYNVQKVCQSVKDNFVGLCLDCMDISKPKIGDVHRDYWLHDRLQVWDKGCRIRHGRSTWYFSFMGRREEMDAHQREQRRRKEQLKIVAPVSRLFNQGKMAG